MKKIILITISGILVLIPLITLGESFPPFPMAFWGTVSINGNPAPVGTVIRAKYYSDFISSTLAGTITVQESGIYGYTEPIKQKLVIGEGTGELIFTFQLASFNGGLETSGCDAVSYTGFTSDLTVEKNLAFNTTGCGGGGGGSGSVDGVPPIITLNSGNATIYKGSTYIDAGATALDNADGNITTNIVTINPVNTNTVGTYIITYNVSDAAGNHAIQVTRMVNVLPVSSSSQLLSGNTTVSASNSEILVGDNNTANSTVTIPDNVTNATINVSALTTSTAIITTATIQGAISINASTTIGAVKIEIPAGIQIVAETSTWNGIINVPQVKPNSTVTATPDSGNTATVSSVIEIGYGDTKLTFNKAVRIKITSQAGKYVGYSRNGVFTPITNVCSVDSQVTGDALAIDGDCKISVGSDLIIWTKHFTNFVTYTQTAIIVASSGGGGGGGGGGGYTPPVITIKGDINGDGKVDKYDFSLMMSNWGKTGSNICDLNNDSKVDKYDFALLMSKWGL